MTAKRVVVVGSVPPFRGGIAQHTGCLADALAQLGHQVQVESWGSQYPRRLYQRAQIDPDVEPLRGARFSLRWFDPISWLRVARRSRGADVMVIPWVTPFHAVILRTVRAISRPKRTVVMLHNVWPHEQFPLVKLLTQIGLRGVDRFVCHARSLHGELETVGLRVDDIRTLPHPPQLGIALTPQAPRPPVRLLFLGFQRAYKGPDIAVGAVDRVLSRGRDVTLTVAGERWDDSVDLRASIAEARLTQRVTLIERYLDDDELVGMIRDHHLLLAPYRSATQSGVVSLALSGGRPVVATAVGGLPDVVIEGQTGVLSAPDDVEAFADAIERALDGLETLSRSVRSHRSTWQDVAHEILDTE